MGLNIPYERFKTKRLGKYLCLSEHFRILHNDELSFFKSPSFARISKSRLLSRSRPVSKTLKIKSHTKKTF